MLNTPLFQKTAHHAIQQLNIRNGGQHNWSDRIQDALISRFAENTHIDRMGYQPCIIYLNGEYWGAFMVFARRLTNIM